MLKVSIEIPVIEELDLDVPKIEQAIVDGVRERMRRKGLPKGKNMEGTQAAAVLQATSEVVFLVDEELEPGRIVGLTQQGDFFPFGAR